MADLFGATASGDNYDASNIEVLEGLEPVRHRPGMYIGGTDDRALHHLAAEILDNSMDEAVAGHANRIDITLESADTLSIRDNGRGMPVGQHPKFPDKSAVEVIMTTLHAGGKFSGKSYATSGGLHGVGASVVNALSLLLTVEIARDKKLYSQTFSRGLPQGKLTEIGSAPNRRGTSVASLLIPRFSVTGRISSLPPSSAWRNQRRSCLPALKSAGNVILHCSPMMMLFRLRRYCIIRVDLPII